MNKLILTPLAIGLSLTSGLSHALIGDDPLLFGFKADQLEWRDADEGNATVWAASAWLGKDLNKVRLTSDGERLDNSTESIETQLLYSRAIDSNWDLQVGYRHDSLPTPDRDWGVIGLLGIAPYWFEIDTALFIGEDDRVAFRFESEYEFMITQRWVLSPEIELNWHSKDDDELGIASGFTSVEAGLRLRYEITREFAPYIGVNYESLLGDTADIVEDNGEDSSDTQLVVGMRFWF